MKWRPQAFPVGTRSWRSYRKWPNCGNPWVQPHDRIPVSHTVKPGFDCIRHPSPAWNLDYLFVDFGRSRTIIDGATRRPASAVHRSWRSTGVGLKWTLGTTARTCRSVRGRARCRVRLRAAALRGAEVRPRLACDAFMEAAGCFWPIPGHEGRSARERSLAAWTHVLSLPTVRAASNALIRPTGEARAALPAMLGVELREPVLELQSLRGVWPPVRSCRLRDHG